MGAGGSVPKDSPLGLILSDWATSAYPPMTKRKMVFYSNTVWPLYILGSGERWPLNGSLNSYHITTGMVLSKTRKVRRATICAGFYVPT